MKKLLLGLLFSIIFFAGFGAVDAWSKGCEEEIGTPQENECKDDLHGRNFIEKGLVIPGKITRELEEFNLRVMYYSRPYKERSLSFVEWSDLYGYNTYGAGPIPHGDFSLPDASEFGQVGANTDLKGFILNVTNWVLSFLGLICVVMIIYAGYLYIIAGEEDGHEKGKKIIMYVAIGIILILVSYALVNTIIKSTTEGGDNFAGITSISTELVEGNIEVSVGAGSLVTNYGTGYIIPDASTVTFKAESNDSEPYDLRWNFGDGTIVNTDNNSFSRSFFDQGSLNIIVIGKIMVTEIVNGEAGDIKEAEYMAKVNILVGDSAMANFEMSPRSPKKNEEVNFDARNARAMVGVIEEYLWECSSSNNEGICDGFDIAENRKDFSFLFQDTGEVTITLTLKTNAEDEAGVFSKTFNVVEESSSSAGTGVSSGIQASFQSKINPKVGESVKFIGSILPAGLIADEYEWECEAMGSASSAICANFNNSSLGNDKVFYTTFLEQGSVKISLIVKTGEGDEEISSVKFEKLLQVEEADASVQNQIQAKFQVSKIRPKAGENVKFTGMTLPSMLIADEYEWECEELYSASPIPEDTICNEFNIDSGIKKMFYTSFPSEGTVKVSLIVKKDGKSSVAFEKLLQVTAANDTIEDNIEARFQVSKTNLVSGESVRFTGMILPAGLIADEYIWGCEGKYSSGKSICSNFNNENLSNPIFYTSFPSAGTVRIFLIVKKGGKESEVFEKLLYIEEEGMMLSTIDFNADAGIKAGEVTTFSVTNINKDYKSFEWEVSNLLGESVVQGLEGEVVNIVLDNVGEYAVTLMAQTDTEESVDITKEILVTEKGSPVPILLINGKMVFSNDLIEVGVGEDIEFKNNSLDSSGNEGANANITYSWVLNGSIVSQEALLDISAKAGLYSLKLNAISTINSNNRNSLQFKIKVLSEKAEINLEVNENKFLGSGFFEINATVNTENINIKNYKFEVLEAGKTVSAQVINSEEKNMKVVMDVSDNVGKHKYVFQVAVTEKNGLITKKYINKDVEIKEEENFNNPPTVEIFTTPSTSGSTSTLFHFYIQSDDLDNDFLTYKWEFPNGKKVLGETANHKFLNAGDNIVKITVSDGLEEVSSTETINVTKDENSSMGNSSPVILSSGISPGNTGNTNTLFRFYSFAEDPDSDEISYSWIMGDGNEINLQNTTYQYQFPGKYTVKLMITDGQKTVTKNIPITVVKKGEDIPTSTVDDYEEENDVTNNSDLTTEDISIGNSVEEESVEDFSMQVDEALRLKLAELERKKANDVENQIDILRDEYKNTTDPNRKKEILDEIRNKRGELSKIKDNYPSIDEMENEIDALRDEYNNTTDPNRKKEILDEINKKKEDLARLKISDLEGEMDFLRDKYNGTTDPNIKKQILEERAIKRAELAEIKNNYPNANDAENPKQEKLEKEIDSLFNEYNNTTDPNRKKEILEEINKKQLELTTLKASNSEKLQKEVDLMNQINDLLSAYENTDDPNVKKQILNAINQKRIELEELDNKLNFKFVGLEGSINTKFFFYSKIPQSDRPVLIKWQTGDNRVFIGPNVSWKYTKSGNYIVEMEVSDGIVMATDSINIKIK